MRCAARGGGCVRSAGVQVRCMFLVGNNRPITLGSKWAKWWHEPNNFRKGSAEFKARVWRDRQAGVPFQVEAWETHAGKVRDRGVTQLPFMRNPQRLWQAAVILGEPPNTKPARIQRPGDERPLPARPYNIRTSAHHSVNNHQAFIGTFLNSFVAMDGEEWDMDALLSDVESPDPETVLRHLTSLLSTRHMQPRRMSDDELAPLLRRCAPGSVERVWRMCVESHAPGMRCLRHAAVSCKDAGLARRMLADLDARGVPRTVDALNAVLSAHTRPEDAAEGLRLFDSVAAAALPADDQSSDAGAVLPTLATYNAALRSCSAAARAGDAATAARGVEIARTVVSLQVPANRHTARFAFVCGAAAESGAAGYDVGWGLVHSLMGGCISARELGVWSDVWNEAATALSALSDEEIALRAPALLEAMLEVSAEAEDVEVDGRSVPSVWHFDGVARLASRAAPSIAAALEEMSALARDAGLKDSTFGSPLPAAVEAFLSACAAAAASDAAMRPALTLLAEGMWTASEKGKARSTRRVYTAMLRVAASSGHREMADAVLRELELSPLGVQDSQRELALEASAARALAQ